MITGARQGTLSGLHRLVANAMAHDLCVFVIPGSEIARAHGLDIEATGMQQVVSPRHASVLLVIGELSPMLREAAAVIYAQMVRPRALFVLGTEELSSLPAADVVAGLSQQDLIKGVHQLRNAFAEGAFREEVSDFEAPILEIRIEYTCSMHPEIVRDEPGSCPKCGMNLIQREAQATAGHPHSEPHEMHTGMDVQETSSHDHDHDDHHHMDHETPVEYTCPMHPEVMQSEPGSCPKCGMNLEPRNVTVEYTCSMHPEVVQSEPGSCPKCGMNLEPRNVTVEYTCPMHPEVAQSEPGSCPKCGMNLEPRNVAVEYTCSMHPEVVQSEPGSCPKCGMNLERRETHSHEHSDMDHGSMDHSSMDHAAMNHDDMGFMSMIDVTKDLPRSGDGLPMEWIEAPFGPFFPGLPGGLLLTLTLDGDTIAGSKISSLVENTGLLQDLSLDSDSFIKQLTGFEPLAPVAYRLLACKALENAAGMDVPDQTARARIGALERERIVSHLGWLALFAEQTGFHWLMQRAASLQLKLQHAGLKQVLALKPAIRTIINRLKRTPLLKSRTAGIGILTTDMTLRGPVARAAGINEDARQTDKIYTTLGFTTASGKTGDALARLHLRLEEITHSLALIEAAGAIELPELATSAEVSATGEAVVETARGMARLQLTLEKGQIISAQLDTPSTHHLCLVESLIDQQELGDALVAVGSLDLSPWEVRQ